MLEYKQKRNNGRTPFAGVYKFVCVCVCVWKVLAYCSAIGKYASVDGPPGKYSLVDSAHTSVGETMVWTPLNSVVSIIQILEVEIHSIRLLLP